MKPTKFSSLPYGSWAMAFCVRKTTFSCTIPLSELEVFTLSAKALVESRLWNVIAALGFSGAGTRSKQLQFFLVFISCVLPQDGFESFADFQTLFMHKSLYINNFSCVAGAHSPCPSHSNNFSCVISCNFAAWRCMCLLIEEGVEMECSKFTNLGGFPCHNMELA
jgi:hypothetical protein